MRDGCGNQPQPPGLSFAPPRGHSAVGHLQSRPLQRRKSLLKVRRCSRRSQRQTRAWLRKRLPNRLKGFLGREGLGSRSDPQPCAQPSSLPPPGDATARPHGDIGASTNPAGLELPQLWGGDSLSGSPECWCLLLKGPFKGSKFKGTPKAEVIHSFKGLRFLLRKVFGWLKNRNSDAMLNDNLRIF